MKTESKTRLGMIGLDTTHATEFARIINADPKSSCRVVAGFPGGSDIPESRDRLDAITAAVQQSGVKIVGSIAEILDCVDVVLLESVDGSVHLEQLRPVFEAGRPVFIDKPVAASWNEVRMIGQLAQQTNVCCWSSSALRFCQPILNLSRTVHDDEVTGCATWGPIRYQQHLPDLFFYGIHGIEALFTIMGTGCQSVCRTKTEHADLVTGVWQDGRVGTYRGLPQPSARFGATAFRNSGSRSVALSTDYSEPYRALCREIVRFAETGAAPVPFDTTMEIYAFMDAADRSLSAGGTAVDLTSGQAPRPL